MAAVASVPPWNPEDDLLLKNAVEAGASLEALAKGAVRFSRKFTVRELRERWHSLLYDADISAEASSRMVEFELSKSNRFGIPKENVGISAKRKSESIRRLYYSRQKRTCSSSSFDLSFLNASNNVNNGCVGRGGDCGDHVAVGNEVLDGNCMVGHHVGSYFEFSERGINIVDHVPLHTRRDVSGKAIGNSVDDRILRNHHPKIASLSARGSAEDNLEHNMKNNIAEKGLRSLEDNLVDFGNCSDGEDAGQSHVLLPLWKTIEDIPAPEMPIDVGLEDKGQNVEDKLTNPPDDVEANEVSASGYDVDHSQLILEDKEGHDEVNRSTDFAYISDSLLDLTSENEPFFMDVDGKNTIDKSCDESVNSLLLSSPKDMHEDDVPTVCGAQTLDTNIYHVVSDDVSAAGMDATSELLHFGDGDQHSICCSEVNISSFKSVENPPSELHDEMMECTLNTEDPEIPCNDNIHHPISTVASDPASFPMNQKHSKQDITSLKKEESHVQSFLALQNATPKTRANNTLVSCAVKRELPDGNCLVPVLKHANNFAADLSQCRSAHGTPKSTANQVLIKEEINTALISTEPCSTNAAFMEAEANSSALDRKESEDGFDGDIHNVPYFSDIETMILEMDLCPDDEDPYVSKEVLRYQHEETKRRIIRLEQCARSSMQRAIASRNAFAILYGRHLKQYIRKTEVILGRATEENEVDIDLGKEGRANKISRKQALIKMEGDGSFFLKNIGKSPIFLNGKEVANGQLLSLYSSSLIEIRGMSFVFEMNLKSVMNYLANISKNSQEKHTNFQWSPKGNHE
ncbi:uncharacterized protein LOC107409113 [Ziziphus jujuba]|uniref:Uncharacterized protein LOC107409113 n=1 Tax=Ziziphus jujuba TaxID=326968 RepID=A0ABM3ITB5_ZIZJJ|nr:uncharacterized protein LOC107409113 [Ziziphus jujuba]XP_048335081.2 uncharacterized protein LOC107409113 [Ziziphus jujuba]XP_048335082.2 uncharacterized protein LOC107409113 [Ziziphus jujuba]XP_048335083.2 uncharacterized protein LOC107409113 [Ziziphus jujuba]